MITPRQRLKAWWWKRNHPREYEILEAFIKAYEIKIEEQGGLFPTLVTDWELRMKAQIYSDLAMTAPVDPKVWIIDAS